MGKLRHSVQRAVVGDGTPKRDSKRVIVGDREDCQPLAVQIIRVAGERDAHRRPSWWWIPQRARDHDS